MGAERKLLIFNALTPQTVEFLMRFRL